MTMPPQDDRPYPKAPARLGSDRLARDVQALALIAVGCAGLVVAAFLADPIAGLAAMSALVAALGVIRGIA